MRGAWVELGGDRAIRHARGVGNETAFSLIQRTIKYFIKPLISRKH